MSVGKLSEESPFFGLRVSHSEQAAEDIHQSPEALPEVVEAISESNLSTTSARAGSDDAISTDPSVFKYLDASLPEQALAEEKSPTNARPVEAEASSKVAAIVIGHAYLHSELVHTDAESAIAP